MEGREGEETQFGGKVAVLLLIQLGILRPGGYFSQPVTGADKVRNNIEDLKLLNNLLEDGETQERKTENDTRRHHCTSAFQAI